MSSNYKTAAPAVSTSLGMPDLSSVDRTSLAQVATLQAQKIDVLQRQVGTLVQSLTGISASWFNDVQAYDENAARILLEYLHAGRPISGDIEELFRAVYYSAGGVARRRESPVPPAPFEIAPPPFKSSAASAEAAETAVLKQGDYWRATVAVNPISGTSAQETASRLRSLLAERAFNVTVRRIDVYPGHGMIGNLKTITICLYDSDDPSAKKASQCLKELCDLLNEAALTISPGGLIGSLNQLVRLDTLEFVGMAGELAELYCDTKGLKKPVSPNDSADRHWRRNHESL